jgi:hypothetical protein
MHVKIRRVAKTVSARGGPDYFDFVIPGRREAANRESSNPSRSLEIRPPSDARTCVYRTSPHRCHPGPRRYIARFREKPEGWPSGLRRTLGKRVYGKPYRGFESHSLRHELSH